MYSSKPVLRALAPYMSVSCVIAASGAVIYGVGGIGVPLLYGVLLLASVVTLVGYARWDERHHA